MTGRRGFLLSGAALAMPVGAAPSDAVEQALRSGLAAGGVLMFRHALAPGNFDPPGFKLGDCATQRNLNDAGRHQARQIGAWFAARQWRPTRVRSSPWCRCLESARLAFGARVEAWVTHMFVFSALLGEGAGSGEAVLLGLSEVGAPKVILRLTGLAA